MVEDAVIKSIRTYLAGLPKYGIHSKKAVLFGSMARGSNHEWSDIDLIVIAPEFDKPHSIETVMNLWSAREGDDDRIEPIPCGEKTWETDDGTPIYEIARREGIEITLL